MRYSREQKLTTEKKFRRDVRTLRREFPPLFPVRVYRRELTDCLGHCRLAERDGKPSHFVIVINYPMAWQATWQILIHEWAHAISWREGHETVCDHDPEWALALARIYQETVEP